MTSLTVQFNPVFRKVHESEKRYIAMKGSAGSGKSVDTAQLYILRLLQDKGRNLLVMRKSEVTNRDSTFSELVGAINRMGLSDYFKTTMSPLKITCINGNSIIFRGCNDERQREKLKSVTFEEGKLTDVWLEEATEFTQEDFEIIDDRLRGQLPDGQFYQIKLTFNPVSSTHWIKKAFFDVKDRNTLSHSSTYLDNRFIDRAYHERMMRRKELDPEGYKIYGLGNWGEVGGVILKNWKVCDIPYSLDDFDDIAIGQDFGFNDFNAILLLGIKDSDIYILKEIYLNEKDTNEIIEIAEGQIPKNIPMWCDSAEPDRILMWRKAGYNARAVSKEVTRGKKYEVVQIDWLKMRKIFIDPSCVNTIKEIGQWKWQKDSSTGEYLDMPVNFNNDAMAALRYGVEAWRKPRGIEVNLMKGGI